MSQVERRECAITTKGPRRAITTGLLPHPRISRQRLPINCILALYVEMYMYFTVSYHKRVHSRDATGKRAAKRVVLWPVAAQEDPKVAGFLLSVSLITGLALATSSLDTPSIAGTTQLEAVRR